MPSIRSLKSVLDGRDRRRHQWYDWFAWYPVRVPNFCDSEEIVWMERLQRRRCTIPGDLCTGHASWWEYRRVGVAIVGEQPRKSRIYRGKNEKWVPSDSLLGQREEESCVPADDYRLLLRPGTAKQSEEESCRKKKS